MLPPPRNLVPGSGYMRALYGRLRVLAVAFGLLLAAAAANAQSFDDALSGFTADSFSDTETAINAVARSGNPRAARVIEALQDGRLLFDPDAKKVYVKTKDDRINDAATGQPVAGPAPANLQPVRLNNRLRRAVEAALGALSLFVEDPGKRFEAAQAVFKSRDQQALPALESALAKETDPRVKTALAEARAAVVLNMSEASEADKLAAIPVIRARGDQDSVALLAGLPPDTPPAVTKAAGEAIASIQSSLAVWSAAQNTWYGLSLGSVLLLAAIGLAITFGVMGVINMAHGEMVMLGAYTTFVVQEVIRAYNPGLFDYSV